MPTAVLPPMTSKQAKKMGKKSAGQFRYTASQMRRADRREELEERRRKDEEKERKKRKNKRKREEKAETQHEVQRRLLNEGKIALEETWAAVSASQPRLNDFFRMPSVSTRLRPRSAPIESSRQESLQSHKGQSQAHKRQDAVPVAGNVTASQPDSAVEDLSDSELLGLLHSRHSLHHNSHRTLPNSLEQKHQLSTSLHKPDKPYSSQVKQASLHNKLPRPRKSTPKMPKRTRNISPEPQDRCVENQAVEMDEYSEKIEVAEDETADADISLLMEQQLNESFSSNRSVLSDMTVAHVNTRAADKPDTTSVSKDDIGLLTPSKQTAAIPRSRGLPSKSEVPDFPDFSDAEDNDEDWDKENSDPIETPAKKLKMSEKSSAASEVSDKTPFKSSLHKAARGTPKPSSLEDLDDMLDIDFDTNNDDDFSDDELDDQSFAAIAATQKPRFNNIVDLKGSPRKLTLNWHAVVEAVPLKPAPNSAMPPPPTKSALARVMGQSTKPWSNGLSKSLSFSSVNDDDLLDFADQVEEELSQKSVKGKGEEELSKQQNVSKMAGPPMSTQAFMLQMVDEEDDEIE